MKKALIVAMCLVMALSGVLFTTQNNEVLAKTKKPTKVEKLFKNNTLPTSKKEMDKYIKTVKVKIWTRTVTKKKKVKMKKDSMNIRVHKKLVSKFKKAFSGMYKAKFPIKKKETSAYEWMEIVISPTKSQMSRHAYGAAIDINWNDNPINAKAKNTPYAITNKVVKIWKKQGFVWGGDWDKKDNMHFELAE